ncbi:NINE protein [Undibacterium sp. SXout20W]|uniref:NINE protein n=1 Tax=Undibacterium sp. SXout20W TaxID=3413051 RepID=UPI003BF0016E
MTSTQKNKTITTLLAVLTGSIGGHRFYLHGKNDKWGWLHFISLPISLIIGHFFFGQPGLVIYCPLVLSFLISLLEALIIGLTPDEKWDAQHNPNADYPSESSWPLALILVFTVGFGAIALIGTIARAFDLFYTGGAYG